MRFRSLLIAIPVLAWPFVLSHAAVFVNEDFETNTTFDLTPQGVAGNLYCSDGQTLCRESDSAYTEIQTSLKHLGSRSLKAYLATSAGAGAIISPSLYTSPDWSVKTNLFLRFYVYYDPAFHWYDRTKIVVWRIANAPDLYINCNGVSWPWSEDAGSAACDVGLYFGMSPSGSCSGLSPFNADEFLYVAKPSGANKGQSWLVTPGGWYYMEVQVDTANRLLNFWMQRPGDASPTQIVVNKSLVGCSNMDGSGGEYFEDLEVDGFINSVAGPSGGAYYFDDIVIADQYIGPTTNTLNSPPSTPTGLRIR